MPIEYVNLKGTKETADHGKLMTELADVAKGRKPLQEAFDEGLASFQGADKTDDEFREDPEAMIGTAGYFTAIATYRMIKAKQAAPGGSLPPGGEPAPGGEIPVGEQPKEVSAGEDKKV